MKKKIYEQPSVSVYEMEAEPILAGTVQVNAKMDGDDTPLEYGGNTDKDMEYTPW